MNKAVTVEKYFKGIQLLREFDILTYGSFIIGFPGETEETAQETIDFIPQSGLEFYRAQLWYCDTITPVWKKREQYKLKGSSFEWSHATMDSQRAAEIVDEIFMTVKGPVWVPQYNFELDSIFHLIHRGVSVPQIRNFLLGFNDAVRERVNNPSQKNISMEAIKNISRSLDDDSKN